MPVSNTKPNIYSPPEFLEEARQLLDVIRCGHTKEVRYHMRDRPAITSRVTQRGVPSSLAEGCWRLAQWSRPRTPEEPHFPAYINETRYLTAEMVASHLEGKRGFIAVAPPSWVGWFAFDIDLPKVDENANPLPYSEACFRRDNVLADVWTAFDFGTGREPVILRTPGGGYHVYVPLTAKPGQGHNWSASIVKQRVVRRLLSAGLTIKNGHLEVWPSAKVLRLPMGAHMALMHARNPDDEGCLGLVPVHATETEPVNSRVPGFRRSIRSGVQAFLKAFESRRLTLGEWLLEDEAEWSEEYGPYGDDPAAQLEKNQSLISLPTDVSQQLEDERDTPDGYLLRGGAFKGRIKDLLEKGLTESGTRHDACLKLTYYFGVCLGLSEWRAMAELTTWLKSKPHISATKPTAFVKESLAEARQYYRTVVANIGVLPGCHTVSLGLPLSEADFAAFEGTFSAPAVEEAALTILRFAKSHSDALGVVAGPLQVSTSLMKRLCGEKRVKIGAEGGRVRATQLAIEELTRKGVFTLYYNYKVKHYGRHFCCWYKFGSGQLPELNSAGELVVASKTVSEGQLVIIADGQKLGRAKVKLKPSEDVPDIPGWVQRMYAALNIAPLDLAGDISENLGAFRDFKGKTRRKAPKEAKREDRECGTVVMFEDDRGYGFIASDNGGDLFFHQTSICESGRSWRTLKAGDRVEFTRAAGAKGPKALWVSPIVAKTAKPCPPLPANSNTSTGNANELPDWIEYFAESSPLPRNTARWKDWRT